MDNLVDIFTYTLNEDSVGDYLVSPAVAFFCFDSVDFDFEKNILSEDIFDDVKQEQKALKKKKTSDVTGTVYKLAPEQKRALKYLKKKYGRSLVKEIKEYRKNTLAPYQVAKLYTDKSKALYPREVFGMSKEEYLKYKKSAEEKIANMRSNKYYDLQKEVLGYHDKQNKINDLEDFFSVKDISEPALNKVFKKYGIYSTRFTDAEFRSIQRKLNNVEKVKKDLIAKIAKEPLNKEDAQKLKDAIEEVNVTKKELSSKEDDTDSNLRSIKALTKAIKDTTVDDDVKDRLSGVIDDIENTDIKLTSKSFEDEYDNFLMREKIRNDIKSRKDNKYVDDYKHMLKGVNDSLEEKKKYTLGKMAKERESKSFSEMEKKIYELKPGARKDSDRLSDYTLKIKEEDFFDPKFYQKDEKFKDAERKIDAEIKRFERGLEAKMEPKDFQLLRKYRLISNLITIKNAKLSDVFKEKKEEEKPTENDK